MKIKTTLKKIKRGDIQKLTGSMPVISMMSLPVGSQKKPLKMYSKKYL